MPSAADSLESASALGEREQPLGANAPSWGRIWLLALPVLGEYLLNMSVSWSDAVLAGTLLREDKYLAAITLGSYVHWLVDGLVGLVSVGAHVLIAQRLGAGRHAQANQWLGQALLLGAALGALLLLVVWFGVPALTSFMGLSAEAGVLTVHYLRIVALSYPLLFVMQVGCYALHAAGRTVSASCVVGLAATVGAMTSWMLAAGCGPLPALGFTGIALGAALGLGLGGLLTLRLLVHGCGPFRLPLALPRPSWRCASQILALGAPASAGTVAVLAASVGHLAIVGRLGDAAVAAHGVAVQCEWLSRLIGDAFAVVAAALVGQALGAGRPDLAGLCVWRVLTCGGGCMLGMGVLFYLGSSWLLGRVVDPEAVPAAGAAIPILRLVAFAQPALAVAGILAWAMQAGAGAHRWPTLLNTLSPLLVTIPLAYLLTGGWLNLGLLGAWWALLIDAHIRAAAMLWCFVRGGWARPLAQGACP